MPECQFPWVQANRPSVLRSALACSRLAAHLGTLEHELPGAPERRAGKYGRLRLVGQGAMLDDVLRAAGAVEMHIRMVTWLGGAALKPNGAGSAR
eukprot:5043899-Pyramimonas_sp.AAC.1